MCGPQNGLFVLNLTQFPFFYLLVTVVAMIVFLPLQSPSHCTYSSYAFNLMTTISVAGVVRVVICKTSVLVLLGLYLSKMHVSATAMMLVCCG